MSMTNIKEAWEVYKVAVDASARSFFLQRVVPFCDQRGWDFIATGGQHGYSFYDPNGKTHNERHIHVPNYWDDKELQKLDHALGETVPGSQNSFGSMMPSYRKERV